jgi:hypothetical protein
MLVTGALFIVFFCMPIVEACTTAIVQTKVDPRVQGRVFAVTHMVAGSMAPLSYVVAGPLADRIFEPLMARSGPLAGLLGPVIGVGPGRGMGLLLILIGLTLPLATVIGYLHPRLRHVEDELPDMIPDDPSEEDLPAPTPAADSSAR